MVKLFQHTSPVAAFNAEMLPRNLQHSYFGLAPSTSSADEVTT